MNKKLQVFVSSTYTDLLTERQAAVQAILSSGHIPAGMELFAAGDSSQLDVIRRWIRESDVFLLILGGRYGSVEPSSQKAYTQLEYEYALEQGIPLFACVVEDEAQEARIKRMGSDAIEREHPQLLRAFRETVLSRMVRFWSDAKDIKLAIHESLSEIELADGRELVGWVRGDQAAGTETLEEIARLSKENADLRARLGSDTVAGVSHDEMIELLRAKPITWDPESWERFFKDLNCAPPMNLLDVLWKLRDRFAVGAAGDFGHRCYADLCRRDLICVEQRELTDYHGYENRPSVTRQTVFHLTATGRAFLNRIELEGGL